MKVIDRNQTNSADITVNDVSMFSKGDNNNNNNNNDNNNSELSHDLNNVNSTTCQRQNEQCQQM